MPLANPNPRFLIEHILRGVRLVGGTPEDSAELKALLGPAALDVKRPLRLIAMGCASDKEADTIEQAGTRNAISSCDV